MSSGIQKAHQLLGIEVEKVHFEASRSYRHLQQEVALVFVHAVDYHYCPIALLPLRSALVNWDIDRSIPVFALCLVAGYCSNE